jgi:hypothetical protein
MNAAKHKPENLEVKPQSMHGSEQGSSYTRRDAEVSEHIIPPNRSYPK